MRKLALFLLLLPGPACVTAADTKADPTVPPWILPTPPKPPDPPAVPVTLTPGHPLVIRLNAATVADSPQGLVKLCVKQEPITLVDADGNDTTYTGDKSICIVSAVGKGACELVIVATDGSGAIGRVALDVGGVGPGPGPGPGPNPFGARGEAAPPAGLFVLIVFDGPNATKMPEAQQAVVYGQTVRDWLRANCAANPDTPNGKAFYILPADTDITGLSAPWQAAWKAKRDSLPWLLIGKGGSGYSGPLPASVDDMMTLLKKFGGA